MGWEINSQLFTMKMKGEASIRVPGRNEVMRAKPVIAVGNLQFYKKYTGHRAKGAVPPPWDSLM